MIVFKVAKDLSSWLEQQRSKGKSIGFVPTMGALHAGHISLIDISKRWHDKGQPAGAGDQGRQPGDKDQRVADKTVTVCSIFVNPTQFNDPKDFQKYPKTIENDILLLERAGTDALFLPEVDEVYAGGMTGLEKYDLGRMESLLEGQYRPGHFQGVCQVMRRLLDLVSPDNLFMGQKDYQQCMVVQRLLTIMGSSTVLHPCPIVREPDGLAMSSRNMRLSAEQRARATAIYKALSMISQGWKTMQTEGAKGPFTAKMKAIVQEASTLLEQNDFRIDYISLADGATLEPVIQADHPDTVALIAAFQGEIRLIDNMALS